MSEIRNQTNRFRFQSAVQRWRGLAGLVLCATLAACSTPPLDDVAWRCTESADCGEGYTCQVSAGLCRAADEDGRNGVSSDRVVFGALLPLSRGPSGAALRWQQGLEAAFRRANQSAGIHGRQLALDVRDDAHDPETALAALSELTGRRQVLAVLGGFGNHVAEVVGAALQERAVPFLGRSGDDDFRTRPPGRYLFALTAGDAAEAAWLAAELTAGGTSPFNIAVLAPATPNGEAPDAQGRSVLAGFEAAGITSPGLGLVPAGEADVTPAVDAVVAWLQARERVVDGDGRVQAAIVLATDAPTAARFARALVAALEGVTTVGRPRFLATSAPGVTELAHALSQPTPDCLGGLRVALGVPSWEAENDVARDFRIDLEAFDPLAEASDLAFEGYLTGRLLAAALEAQGREIAGEVFVDTLERTLVANAGGFALDRHFAIQAVAGATLAPDCTLTLD